jgi:hypothetical protein
MVKLLCSSTVSGSFPCPTIQTSNYASLIPVLISESFILLFQIQHVCTLSVALDSQTQ